MGSTLTRHVAQKLLGAPGSKLADPVILATARRRHAGHLSKRHDNWDEANECPNV